MPWTTPDVERFASLVDGLMGLAHLASEVEMGAPLDPRLAFSLEAVRAGEEWLGLDTLVANVQDYRVVLTEAECHLVMDLAMAWGVDLPRW